MNYKSYSYIAAQKYVWCKWNIKNLETKVTYSREDTHVSKYCILICLGTGRIHRLMIYCLWIPWCHSKNNAFFLPYTLYIENNRYHPFLVIPLCDMNCILDQYLYRNHTSRWFFLYVTINRYYHHIKNKKAIPFTFKRDLGKLVNNFLE